MLAHQRPDPHNDLSRNCIIGDLVRCVISRKTARAYFLEPFSGSEVLGGPLVVAPRCAVCRQLFASAHGAGEVVLRREGA